MKNQREILFRGKNIYTNQFVFGSLVSNKGSFNIIEEFDEYPRMISVDKHTIGQYTGLKDAEGNKIFEGDIVKQIEDYGGGVFDEHVNVVEFEDGGFKIDSEFIHYQTDIDMLVIGNIHDNPTLL